MEYINNNILCLTYDEFVSFFSVEIYKSDKKRGNIVTHGLGGNGRKVFIEFESLKDNRKEVIVKKIGNPYEYLAKQPILDLVDWDYEAQKFYSDFVLPNGDKLPASDQNAKGKPQINYVKRYTKAASWLNMISHLTTDKRALKSTLNLSIMDFWDTVGGLVISEEIALPTNARRLKDKVKAYATCKTPEEKYLSLVEVSKFGNSRSAKIADKESEALLFKMLADARKHDDTVIAAGYNHWAKQNGRETVTPGAIGYFRRKNAHIIAPAREGMKASYTKFVKEIHRDRTSAPLLFINSDDNILDLFFEVERWNDGKVSKSKYYRPALYVIIDTFNNYILGYAYGDRVNSDLIYSAFRNALNHIEELTGAFYLPKQLQTDRWGLDFKMKNQLAEFYKMFGGKFTPQAHGVPQGKYIEASFGTEWHQVLKAMPSNNYAGHNITSKERLSGEYMVAASKNYPTIAEMPAIIESFINVMRIKPNPKTKVSRQKEWVEAFAASEKSKTRCIDTALKLDLLGVKREGNPLTISSKGLQFALNKQKIVLDLPEMVIYEHNGKKVDVIYDPENLNQMLVTDHKGLRFVAGQYVNRPAALADYKPGDRLRLEADFEAKKQISHLMANTIEDRISYLGEDVNAQSLLQAGVLLKDVKHGAEATYLESLFTSNKVIEAPKKQLPPVAPTPDLDEDFDLYNMM